MQNNLRDLARLILDAALAASDPRAAVQRALHREGNRLSVQGREYDLDRIHRVLVIGFGKASAAMAQAAEQVLGDKIERGWVNVKYGHTAPLQTVHLHEAGHPLPDANSLLGAQKILELLDTTAPEDLVICLISGGGSALMELLTPGISLDDLRSTTEALLRSGATIGEINALRKHLSQIKGGQLARRSRAPVLSLILSDVIGSALDAIASGPTAPDSTTFQDALAVIERRGITGQLSTSILQRMERGVRGEIADTPKANDPIFERVQNVIIADNAIACQAALVTAQGLGIHSLLLSTYIQGEAREFAKTLAAIGKEILASGRPLDRPACVIAGGETTVTLRGNGKGGRNQELALAAAIEISGLPDMVILSAGTDGTDGPTDAAGAIADGGTVARAAERGLAAVEHLADNDAYHFFQPLGDLIITGPTNTNVNDLMLLLVQ